MPFVVDASVAACWILPDESNATATQALARLADEDASAPRIWWLELRNTLLTCERRGILTGGQSRDALALLKRLPITLDDSPDEDVLMGLARQYRLTAYDAVYLELATRRGFALASLDQALVSAARAERVALI
jgi:predicted nucleic acid-binding protein